MSIGVALVGFSVGVLIGLTGVGGGVLMTPILVLLGTPPILAVGTDLVYGAITKAVGSWVHLRQGT
ncbi:MAG: TSUP family transporter, partial [Clostridia bacterium]|nr:TSUP family transporter [Clostridia bacterium]